ncbi:hypothetical protein IAU59_001798 [Kwoniella sp. CBS 9459]
MSAAPTPTAAAGSSTSPTSTTYAAETSFPGATPANLNGDAGPSKLALRNGTVNENGNGNGEGNVTRNGDGKGNGNVNGASEADPVIHALNLASWTFNVGYLHQEWADVHFTFFNSGLKAHRLIIARSPYLARLMTNVAPGSVIHLAFQDENITEEAVHIALQHLYNPSHHLINVHNARSVLSTSYLFGGMPELTHHAYTVIRSSLETANVSEYIQWLNAGSGTDDAGFKKINGGVTESWNGGFGSSSEGRYGEWTGRLKQDVLDYLLRALPNQIVSENSPITTDPRLFSVYSKLPYELFKALIENPELPIQSMQDRFAFAKRVIAQRKKVAASTTAATANGNNGPPMEESVVLAFKGGEGMEVHVTRKPKKSRALWKVEG